MILINSQIHFYCYKNIKKSAQKYVKYEKKFVSLNGAVVVVIVAVSVCCWHSVGLKVEISLGKRWVSAINGAFVKWKSATWWRRQWRQHVRIGDVVWRVRRVGVHDLLLLLLLGHVNILRRLTESRISKHWLACCCHRVHWHLFLLLLLAVQMTNTRHRRRFVISKLAFDFAH